MRSGTASICLVSSNIYVFNSLIGVAGAANPRTSFTGGVNTLAGTLDRVRITTVNGTDAFDAGSINIFYEG